MFSIRHREPSAIGPHKVYGCGRLIENTDDITRALVSIPIQSGLRALDVGSGYGQAALYLQSLGLSVVASDRSSKKLKYILQRAKERGNTIETREHLAEALPYPDHTFDLVISRMSGHHFTSPEAFVSQSARVLKKGGAFILIDLIVPDDQQETSLWLHEIELLRDPTHRKILSPMNWSHLCEQSHLKIHLQKISPVKQPGVEEYFETADVSQNRRLKILDLIESIPPMVRSQLWLGVENGTVVWWWKRLTLIAIKL